MKTYFVAFFILMASMHSAIASVNSEPQKLSGAEQEIIDLSRAKWQWMSDCKTDSLDALFHKEAIFVHMGGAMNKEQELGVIKGGMIHYKKADIFEESVRFAGETAILLGRIRLLAVVGGREVSNPFMVTEVYVKENGAWKIAALSFTRLLEPEHPRGNK